MMAPAVISDVTFVVVARNEEFALRKCLESLSALAAENCEVVCVDSDSSDDTLGVMSRYAQTNRFTKVYQCSGQVNSAIARNVGLDNASKSYIFFVDGDVAVSTEFVEKALESIKSGECECVTGKLQEFYYAQDYSKVIAVVEDRFNINAEKFICQSGGCFIVTKAVAEQVGRWDERLDRNQDVDYTLRISARFRMKAIPVSMGIHHTLGYNHNIGMFLQRLYPMLLGMVIRKNLFRPRQLLDIFRGNRGMFKGLVILSFLTACTLFRGALSLSIPSVLLLFALVVALDLCCGLLRGQAVHTRFIGHYLYPPLVLLGCFIDRPRRSLPSRCQRII